MLAKSDTSQSSSLFRESALRELNGVQVLQHGLQVVEAKSIAYLLAALTGIAGVMLWGILGVITVEVPARGIVMSLNQMTESEKLYHNNQLEREYALRSLKSLLAKKKMLYDKRLITLDDLEHARQAYLEATESFAVMPKLHTALMADLFDHAVTSPNDNMYALVFVSHEEAKKIVVGMQVYLLPTFMSSYQYGYIKGKVREVSAFPAAKESVYSYLGNMNLVDEYFVGGAPFVIKVGMEKNAHTHSGLSWTTHHGAPYKISPGTAVNATIMTQQFHPYERLLS